MTAPEQLKAWRKRIGISQVRAAEQIGVEPRTYQRWERGEGGPYLKAAVAIEQAGGPKVTEWVR